MARTPNDSKAARDIVRRCVLPFVRSGLSEAVLPPSEFKALLLALGCTVSVMPSWRAGHGCPVILLPTEIGDGKIVVHTYGTLTV